MRLAEDSIAQLYTRAQGVICFLTHLPLAKMRSRNTIS